MALNKNPMEKNTKQSPSILARKYEYILTVIWYPQAVKKDAHPATNLSLNNSETRKKIEYTNKGFNKSGKHFTV